MVAFETYRRIRINRYITLKLELDDSYFDEDHFITNIYIRGEFFEPIEGYHNTYSEGEKDLFEKCAIFQEWVERNYDTNWLPVRFSFRLLTKILEKETPQIEEIFKIELRKRFETAGTDRSLIVHLIRYTKYLTTEELYNFIFTEKKELSQWMEILSLSADHITEALLLIEKLAKLGYVDASEVLHDLIFTRFMNGSEGMKWKLSRHFIHYFTDKEFEVCIDENLRFFKKYGKYMNALSPRKKKILAQKLGISIKVEKSVRSKYKPSGKYVELSKEQSERRRPVDEVKPDDYKTLDEF